MVGLSGSSDTMTVMEGLQYVQIVVHLSDPITRCQAVAGHSVYRHSIAHAAVGAGPAYNDWSAELNPRKANPSR